MFRGQFISGGAAVSLAAVNPIRDARLSIHDKIDGIVLAEQRPKVRTPAIAVAASRGGRVLYAKGIGERDVALHAVADANTTFALGTTSMQFTAAAVLLLIREKKLAFEDPLAPFVDDRLAMQVKGIKIKHLLTIAAGFLPDFEVRDEQLHMPSSVIRDLERALRDPNRGKPGTRHYYSLLDYRLLALVIEKVAKTSYGAFLHKRIFSPLKMTATREYSRARAANAALGYAFTDDGIAVEVFHSGRFAPYNNDIDSTRLTGAAGLVSNVVDIQRWNAGVHTIVDFHAPKLRRIFEETEGTNSGYFGWQLTPETGVLISDDIKTPLGFQTMNAIVPRGNISVTVLVNTADAGDPTTSPLEVTNKIALALLA